MSKITDLIFKDEHLPTIAEIEAKYPKRNLPENAIVSRVAPSPTGFMHIGTLYAALIPERIAHQSGGVFMLRIEDTDRKRELEGATELISSSLKHYGIKYDEGVLGEGNEFGDYGPYTQSERGKIYRAYVKEFLERGLAYPCFCTEEEIAEQTRRQDLMKITPGYYGKWAKCRTLTENEIIQNIESGKPYVIRYKSHGDKNKKMRVHDLIKGKVDFPEYDLDIVIMKSDRLPTYHFAHLIDDHLMGTTLVLRGDEWLSSLPLHIQLFKTMGWEPPKYAHIAPIQKMDGSSKRKLSKRKDPEANVMYYEEHGYPKDAVIEYLLNLANSSFEDWRRANPLLPNGDFKLDIKKLNVSGALFDFVKLDNISKNVIATYTAERLYDESLDWAKKYDTELYDVMLKKADYVKNIFRIERENVKKVRKDIGKWTDVRHEILYFMDDYFKPDYSPLASMEKDEIKRIVHDFMSTYDSSDTKDVWFDKIKDLTEKNGYASNMKEYKADPSKFKGSIADVTNVIRVLITGRTQSPDIYAVMQVLGKERTLSRLAKF